MTHTCCPSCRLRFTRAAAAVLEACPSCGEPVHVVASPADVIGLRLAADPPEAQVMAAALAVALRTPPEAHP